VRLLITLYSYSQVVGTFEKVVRERMREGGGETQRTGFFTKGRRDGACREPRVSGEIRRPSSQRELKRALP